jgi:hypothetical protein
MVTLNNMAATKDDIRRWLTTGKANGASHLLVVCDLFDYDDYPVYVIAPTDVKEIAESYHGVNMQKVMECYDLSLDLEMQLAERRSWHGWTSTGSFLDHS